MEPAFTLGILYGCGCGFRTAQYFEQLAAYYLKSMSRVGLLIALTGKPSGSVAACLLEQRAKHSGLEVAVVLTAPAMAGISAKHFARQSRPNATDYRRGGSSGGDGTVRGAFFASELFRLFIERCLTCSFFKNTMPGHKWSD